MTHKDEFIERLESYLDEYEGVTPLPDAVRDAIRAELPHTKQIGPLSGLSRFLSMTLQLPAPARYGLAAAVLVGAVAIGANLIGGDNTGEPTASPSPSSSASVTPSGGGAGSLLDSPRAGDLPAGDYYLDHPDFPARVDFSVPDGWLYHWTSASRAASDVHVLLVNSEDTGARNGSFWGVGFGVVNRVRVDPCDANAGYMESSATESAAALAAALATWTSFPVRQVEDVTIGGFSGKRVEVAPAEATTCTGQLINTPSGYMFELPPAGIEPFDNPTQFTFLDVDGELLLLWSTDHPGTTAFEVDGGASPDPQAHAADQVELHEILDSIVITPR